MVTPNTAEPTTRPPRPTVFCIDDDPLVLHFYEDFLARYGYEVVTVTDGLVGLQVARELRPDVILLDVMLRGLSGYDICRKLRADPALRTIPIILLTVWDHASVVTTGREAGATLTLQKTADAKAIVGAIGEVLRLPRDPAAG